MNGTSFSTSSNRISSGHVDQKSLNKGTGVDSLKSPLSSFKPSETSVLTSTQATLGRASDKGAEELKSSTSGVQASIKSSPQLSTMKASAKSFCMAMGSIILGSLSAAKESIGSGRATYLTEAIAHSAESAKEVMKSVGEMAEHAMPVLEGLGGALGIGHAISEFKEGFESLNKAKEAKTMGSKLWNGSMGIAKISTGALYGVAGAAVLAGAAFIAAPILGTVTGGVALIESGKQMNEAKNLSNLPDKMDKLFPSTTKEGVALPKKVNDQLREFASGGVDKKIPLEQQKEFITSFAKALQRLDPGNKAFSTENITREYSKSVKEYAGLKKEVCVNKAKSSQVKAATALTLGWGMVGLAATGFGAALAIPVALTVGVGGYTQWSKFDKAADKAQEKMNVAFPSSSPSESAKHVDHHAAVAS